MSVSRDWNPDLYRRFEEERTIPARDLLARVPLARLEQATDLGCGPGNSTQLLNERFRGADIVGLDSSSAMLETARTRLPGCRFELGDLSTWRAAIPQDLIFSNAVLHWVPDHGSLLPRLFAELAPGGVLALQMPDNLQEPSHQLMLEVASDGPWASALSDASRARTSVLPAAHYYDLLAAQAATVKVWRTVYHHPLPSPAAIVDWLRSSGLRPFLDPLPEPQRAAFLVEYERRVALAYDARSDGRRLLAFPRLFVVAQRPS